MNSGGRSSVGRAPDCDSGCRGFEPHRPPHFSKELEQILYHLAVFFQTLRIQNSRILKNLDIFYIHLALRCKLYRILISCLKTYKQMYKYGPSCVSGLFPQLILRYHQAYTFLNGFFSLLLHSDQNDLPNDRYLFLLLQSCHNCNNSQGI